MEKNNITESQKLWSSSESDASIQDMAHWRSVGRWNEKKWLDIGNSHFQLYEKMHRIAGTDINQFKSMLEWGPGGGANLYRFSESFETLYGVDISKASIEECDKQLSAKGNKDHKLFLIEDDPDIVNDLIDEKLAFFLSVAVFQHFPSRNYGLKVLDNAARLLKKGGLALIQIRYQGQNEKFDDKNSDYKSNFVTFTAYEIDVFWAYCQRAGFEVLSLELMPNKQYAFYMLRRTNKRSYIRKIIDEVK